MTKNGRSLTASSVQRPTVAGTGIPTGPSECMSRCSRDHVVGRGQHVVQRRASQGPGPARGVFDPEGQVGAAAGDQREGERRRDLGDVVRPTTR